LLPLLFHKFTVYSKDSKEKGIFLPNSERTSKVGAEESFLEENSFFLAIKN
jgi:hypothetical protein